MDSRACVQHERQCLRIAARYVVRILLLVCFSRVLDTHGRRANPRLMTRLTHTFPDMSHSTSIKTRANLSPLSHIIFLRQQKSYILGEPILFYHHVVSLPSCPDTLSTSFPILYDIFKHPAKPIFANIPFCVLCPYRTML